MARPAPVTGRNTGAVSTSSPTRPNSGNGWSASFRRTLRRCWMAILAAPCSRSWRRRSDWPDWPRAAARNIAWLRKLAGVKDHVPGAPDNYTSVFPLGGHASGLGGPDCRRPRPIKIEGNPDHRASLGAAKWLWRRRACWAFTIPIALKTVLDGGKDSSWEKSKWPSKDCRCSDGSGIADSERSSGAPPTPKAFGGRLEEAAEGEVGGGRVVLPRTTNAPGR